MDKIIDCDSLLTKEQGIIRIDKEKFVKVEGHLPAEMFDKSIREEDCPRCNGSGKIKVCPECHGMGTVADIKRDADYNATMYSSKPCPNGCQKPIITQTY